MWGRIGTYAVLALVLGSFALFALATPFGFILLILGITALLVSGVQWWLRVRRPPPRDSRDSGNRTERL